MGGWADQVLERVARMGDGWMPMGNPEDVESRIVRFRELLKKNKKNPDTFPIMGGDGRGFSLDGRRERPTLSVNDMDGFVEMIKRWKKLEVSHIAFRTHARGLKTIDEHLRRLEVWKKEFDNQTGSMPISANRVAYSSFST